jgi:hypothetical protein
MTRKQREQLAQMALEHCRLKKHTHGTHDLPGMSDDCIKDTAVVEVCGWIADGRLDELILSPKRSKRIADLMNDLAKFLVRFRDDVRDKTMGWPFNIATILKESADEYHRN